MPRDDGELVGGAWWQQPARWQRACALSLRVSAWMMHAMIDGMVLSSAPSTSVLAATAVPVTVCALQDVAAFTVAMVSARVRARARVKVKVRVCVWVRGGLGFGFGFGLGLG